MHMFGPIKAEQWFFLDMRSQMITNIQLDFKSTGNWEFKMVTILLLERTMKEEKCQGKKGVGVYAYS